MEQKRIKVFDTLKHPIIMFVIAQTLLSIGKHYGVVGNIALYIPLIVLLIFLTGYFYCLNVIGEHIEMELNDLKAQSKILNEKTSAIKDIKEQQLKELERINRDVPDTKKDT